MPEHTLEEIEQWCKEAKIGDKLTIEESCDSVAMQKVIKVITKIGVTE